MKCEILDGTISEDCKKLVGSPVADGATIEYPSQGGATGVRVVSENGNGLTEFGFKSQGGIVPVIYTVDSNINMATMKVKKITDRSTLSEIINIYGWNSATHDLTIIGYGQGVSLWQDFQFNYSEHGKPGKLHIQDITLSTETVDGYAVYTLDTLTSYAECKSPKDIVEITHHQ